MVDCSKFATFALSIRNNDKSVLNIMKVSELKRKLRKAGCLKLREGTRHEIWTNPKTGSRTTVPRHDAQEVNKKTACTILKELLG